MFDRIFNPAARTRRPIVDALYETIVAAARQPAFYAEWKVPDTPLGRFEMVALHCFLFLHRMRAESGAGRDIAQEVTDEFFRDVEHSLRELGIGDMGVPKRMKKLARMFYGRAAAYGDAIDKADAEALAAALTRNILPDARGWPESAALASYVLRTDETLAGVQADAILSGRLDFPHAQGAVSE